MFQGQFIINMRKLRANEVKSAVVCSRSRFEYYGSVQCIVALAYAIVNSDK